MSQGAARGAVPPRRSNKDGYQSICKDCVARYHQAVKAGIDITGPRERRVAIVPQGMLTTRREFCKWYLSTDWILLDAKPVPRDSGIMEVSVGRFSEGE